MCSRNNKNLAKKIEDTYVDDKDVTIEVVLDDETYIFSRHKVNKKIYKKDEIKPKFFQTSYRHGTNTGLLIVAYKQCRDRILLLRLLNVLSYNASKKSINIYTKDIIEELGFYNTQFNLELNNEEYDSIYKIIDILYTSYMKNKHQELLDLTLDEPRLYKYKNKIFGVVDCPFKLGEYLPKVKVDNFYIINNLLSRCPVDKYNMNLNLDSGYFQQNPNIFFTWFNYIVKYHINNYDYKSGKKDINTICFPNSKFKYTDNLYLSDKIGKDFFEFGWIKYYNKLIPQMNNYIYNTIIQCHKQNGLFVSRYAILLHDLYSDYNKEKLVHISHSTMIIINFSKKEILFANPWGVKYANENSNFGYKDTFDITYRELERLRNTFVKKIKIKGEKTRKVRILKDFKIIPFRKCSPDIGPQGNDPYCAIWTTMIIHLYLLNYKTHKLYDVIEYLKKSSRDALDFPVIAEQYDYLTRQIIPEKLTKEWFKKAGLSVPYGY